MWQTIKNWFNKLLRAFWGFFNKVGKILAQQGADLLVDITRKTVEEMAQTDLSDSEKREQAFNRIKIYAATKSIKAADSLVYTLIELAVQEYKAAIKD